MSKFPALSICIPAYEMGGYGVSFLRHSLVSLMRQDFEDFEVVVADQSGNTAIKELCAEYSERVRHIHTYHLVRQASANTNAAVEAADGEVIKILFQDDYLAEEYALSNIMRSFEASEVNWCITGSLHTYDTKTLFKPLAPKYHDRIQFGRNTISSPSVLAYRRYGAPTFDESLTWLMDVDFYKQCGNLWGSPAVIPRNLVVNRLHKDQVSEGIDRSHVRRELRYVYNKYSDHLNWADRLHYLGQLRKTWL